MPSESDLIHDAWKRWRMPVRGAVLSEEDLFVREGFAAGYRAGQASRPAASITEAVQRESERRAALRADALEPAAAAPKPTPASPSVGAQADRDGAENQPKEGGREDCRDCNCEQVKGLNKMMVALHERDIRRYFLLCEASHMLAIYTPAEGKAYALIKAIREELARG